MPVTLAPDAAEIAQRWASMDAFLFAKRYPDAWIDHARRDIPNLIAWLQTEQEMHAAWRKRAEEAEGEIIKQALREKAIADHAAKQEKDRADALEGLLLRIHNWDHMGTASDGAYWRETIRKTIAIAKGEQPITPA
jgi:uncharacterized protein YijF (DUF1287 family)